MKKMNIFFKTLIFVVSWPMLPACGDQRSEEANLNYSSRPLKSLPTPKIFSTIFNATSEINITDSVNYIDQNGLKQGLHITRGWKNKILCKANYRNDTLNGYFWEWKGYIRDGNMVNGKREGIFYNYYAWGQVESIINYENDSATWFAPYAANQTLIAPVKYIQVHTDSVFLKIDHPNGNRWYEGLFLQRTPVGNHLVYDSLGVLKGTITYSNEVDSSNWYNRKCEVFPAEL